MRVAVDAVCRKWGVHTTKHGFRMGGLRRRRRALRLRDDWLFHCRLYHRAGTGIAPSYADAIISAGLGVIVLGQALTPVQILGIAIVILALIGAQRRPKSR